MTWVSRRRRQEKWEEGSHVRVATGTLITQDLHSDDVGGFGNTIRLRDGGTGTVSPVAISVRVLVWAKGLPPGGTSFEVGVLDKDTGIYWIE